MNSPILEVKNLKKYFPINSGKLFGEKTYLKAVNDVTFSIEKGKTLGLIGESGCGKSTIGKAVMGLSKATSGSIKYKGIDINSYNAKEMKEFRRNVQMIFQDP